MIEYSFINEQIQFVWIGLVIFGISTEEYVINLKIHDVIAYTVYTIIPWFERMSFLFNLNIPIVTFYYNLFLLK